MGELAQSIVRDLTDELAETFEATGGEMVADIRNDISVPVQYLRKPYRIVRSKPGESPRRETGDLWRGVQMEVDRPDPESVSLEVFCTVLYGKYLETGTDKMERRPWWETAWLRWRDRVASLANRQSR